MTWNDEIVEEVRRVRQAHAAKFAYDISAICADIRRQQAESKREIVSLAGEKTSKNETDKKQPDLLKTA